MEGGGLESTTLANVPPNNETLTWGGLDQSEVFVVLSCFDAVSITIFMITCCVLIRKQDAAIEDNDLIQTTPSDYSVSVEDIPADVRDPIEIKRYFENLLKSVMSEEEVRQGFYQVAEVVIHHECASILDRSEQVRRVGWGCGVNSPASPNERCRRLNRQAPSLD